MNELQRSGAQPSNKQPRFVPIWVGSLRSGLVTNRSPLIGSTAPRLMEKFYGTSGDLFIDGSNTEISSRFTLIRRPGNSVYNAGSFTSVDSFYEFRLQNGTIKVIADTGTQVKDITGSNNITILNKNGAAGQTYFQSVLNTIFMGDGAEQKKWAYTTNVWTALTSFTPALAYVAGNEVQPGYTILDSNSNLQVLTTAGTSAGSPPTWATTLGATTADGTAVWTCYGSPIQNWGLIAPSTAASPVNAALSNTPFPSWSGTTFFGPSPVIQDNNGNIELLTTAGVTGGSQPTWNVSLNGTTADGSAVWTNKGSATWQAVHAYAAGAFIQVTYSVGDVEMPNYDVDLSNLGPTRVPRVRSYKPRTITYTDAFQVLTAGTTAGSQPLWQPGAGTLVNDGTVVWKNVGRAITSWAGLGALNTVSLATKIIDTNGNIQAPLVAALTGASAPAWSITQGAITLDGNQQWQNMGPIAAGAVGAGNSGTWIYGYAFKNSVANTVSSCSTPSDPILLALNSYVLVQGDGSTDPQCDTIIIFRTIQGGSNLWWLGEIPNPGSGKTWTFKDTYPDSAVDQLIAAPIDGANQPPPAGLVHLQYHLNRVWGNVGNVVVYSNPLTTTLGSGTEQFPAGNYFVFPSVVTRLEPVSSGLMVFTTSDIYMIAGQGTDTSILYSYPYVTGIGLLSYNCLTSTGSTFYLYTSSRQVISLDPASGYSEPGFPIGDKLLTLNPLNAYITWHNGGARDTALFIGDGSTGWFRLTLNHNSSVESPVIWSPFATIVGGCKAVKSVETSPGVKQLLIGPSGTGPILKRDFSVSRDNGTSYSAFATIGSIVLAEPGQMAEISFIAADSIAVAGSSKPAISVLLDEAVPYYTGSFAALTTFVNDPPKLSASTSLFSNRYYLNQTQQPAWCRHLQIKLSWPAENFANELLSLSLFGALWAEK